MVEIGDKSYSFEHQCNTEDNETRDLIRNTINKAITAMPTITIQKTEWDSKNGYVEYAGLYNDKDLRDTISDTLLTLTQDIIIDESQYDENGNLIGELTLTHVLIDPNHVYHRYCLEDKEYMGKCKNCGMHIRIDGEHFENTECDAPVTLKEQISIPLDPTKPMSPTNYQLVDSDKPLLESVIVKSIERNWGNPAWKIMGD